MLSSVHAYEKFSPVTKLRFQPGTVHMGNFSSVTEMNEMQAFKFHPSNWDGMFIWENF